jgi:hypothetical protein
MSEHPDDVRKAELQALMKSPEAEIIGKTLANIERQRLKMPIVLALEDLERDEQVYYREKAVMAIRGLDQEQLDEAIYAAAMNYAAKAWDKTLESLNEHRRGHAIWATRSIVNMFGHTLSGHLPLRGSEARAWKSLQAKMEKKLEKIDAVTV